MAVIQRDTIPDRIGTVLWWLVIILSVISGIALKEIIACVIVGTLIAYGLYYLITGRTD